MNARFDETKYRPFSHAISCLSRFGDKVNVLCLPAGEKDHVLRLSAINALGSAFCAFYLPLEFFEEYSAKKRHDLRLQLRNVQAILKGQVNRHLQHVELELLGGSSDDDDADEDDNDEEACRFAFRLHGKSGVIRTHKLTYEAKVGLFPRDEAKEFSEIRVNHKTIQELLDHFAAKSNGEITMQCASDTCHFVSTSEDFSDKYHRRTVSTKVEVKGQVFAAYNIRQECYITFGLREFKACIALADHLAVPMRLQFSQAGNPLIVMLDCKVMLAQIFIATSEAVEQENQESGDQVVVDHAIDPTRNATAAPRDPERDSVVRSQSAAVASNAAQTSLGPANLHADHVESGAQAAAAARSRGDALASTQVLQDVPRSGGMGAARVQQPMASTPLAAARDDERGASADPLESRSTSKEDSLFRGMDEDESYSQRSAASLHNHQADASVTDTSAAAMQSQANAQAPTQRLAYPDELPSVWPDDSSMTLTFDDETRLARAQRERDAKPPASADGSASSSAGATDEESDAELASTQHADQGDAKRRRYEPLF